MFIYIIVNTSNMKSYVGYDSGDESSQNRWKQHQGYGSGRWVLTKSLKGNALYRAMKKYGIENFSYRVIDRATSLEELIEKEIYWIAFYGTFGGGYNLSIGGDGGDIYGNLSEYEKLERNAKVGKKVSEAWHKLSDQEKERRTTRLRTDACHYRSKLSLDDRLAAAERLRQGYRKWWDNLSDENKNSFRRKISDSSSFDHRSKKMKKVWATYSEDKRLAITQKSQAKLAAKTPQEKAEILARRSATYSETYQSLSEESRSEKILHNKNIARKYWDNVTPEQITARSEKARATRDRKKRGPSSPLP